MIEELRWEPLFVMNIKVAGERAKRFGPTTAGMRAAFPVDGGTFEGKRLRGVVNGDGMDWITLRSDQSMTIDVRMTLTTDDGAVIGMSYTGIARTLNPDDWDRFARREILPDDEIYLHTAARFETGDPRYDWLNRIMSVTNGNRTQEGGVYHVFEIL